MHVEVLRAAKQSSGAKAILGAMVEAMRAAGDHVLETPAHQGGAPVLMLWGIGAPAHDAARQRQIAAGGRVAHFDLGYFGPDRRSYARMSIDGDHPHHLLDATPSDSKRWEKLKIGLREDADAGGPVLLIGLGRKSRQYLQLPNWERDKLAALQSRFPCRRIVFRPKGDDSLGLRIPVDGTTPIAHLLRGASMAVCRHSNVAVDAAIAGVPFECEEGAGVWLQRREYTASNRLDFLRRLACWQYRPDESAKAWAFAKGIMQCA